MKYPWLDTPMTLEYMVCHCVEDAPGLSHHFVMDLFLKRGLPFTKAHVRGALQRAKRKGLVKNQGSYWSIVG